MSNFGLSPTPSQQAYDVVIVVGAIMGPYTEVRNFVFLNGFCGQGLQQSPAMGRGTAEWLAYGEYRSLDLPAFAYRCIANHAPIIEKAIV
jgi:glycine/D-amino acid oxidase-like deaminating enzyme